MYAEKNFLKTAKVKHRRKKQMKRNLWITLALALLLPAALYAQSVTNGAFSGKVVDMDGKPVMGAEISLLHVPTGTKYATLTRSNGNFSVAAVRVGGPYTITVTYQGFKPETQENIMVKLGENKAVNFSLQLATVDAGEVVVTASDSVINPYRTGTSQNVAEEAIRTLPTISRSLSDFTRLSPQIVGNEEMDGSFSMGGRSSRYNNIQVDGAQNNDLFGLGETGTPGGQAETTPVSLEAVQEFQIVLAPYDVRQGMFTGGGVNVITKGGSNRFKGSVYLEGRNESLVGKGPLDFKYPAFKEGTYGASIGGPIIKNKLFFFVSGEMSTQKKPEDYYIDGSGQGFDFGHKAEADRFISILSNLGYNAGGYDSFTNERTSKKIFARLDLNINTSNHLSLRHNFVDADKDSLLRTDNRTFYFGNAGIIYQNKTNSTVLELDSTLGSSLHNQLILNYSTIHDLPTYMGEAFPTIVVSTGGVTFRAGADEYRHYNELKQDLIEVTDTLTLYKGKHTFIFGTHNEFFKFYNVYVQRAFGKYEFRSLDDLENGKPYRYDRYYSLMDDPKAPAQFSVYQIGLYAGDEWAVSPNLTLTLGVRADVPLMPDDPLENSKVFEKFGIHTNQNAGGNLLWSPRVGFNLDLFGNQKTQVRGGVGIFSGRTPYVWISNQYSNTGMDLGRLYLTSNINFFVTDPYGQPTNPNPIYSGDINLIDKNYKFPQVFKTNIAVDHKLPFGFTGTLEFVYSRSIKEIAYQNINIAATGLTNKFDGRPMFGTQSTSGSNRYGSPNFINKDFMNVILLKNTNKGFQYSFTVQVQREHKGNLISASYTNGMSKDINSGTSSRAISNWQYNINTGDPNNPELTYSAFDIRHRIMFALTKKFNFFKTAPTFFSIFYNGRSGRPYSMIYYNDINGDGYMNDSIYVPTSADELILTKGTWDELDKYLNDTPGVNEYRGKILPRYSCRDPFYHEVDLKIAQDIPIPGLKDHRLELFITVQNFLNLFDKDWSVYRYISFDDAPLTFLGYDSASGKPKFEFWGKSATKDARFTINQALSRWKALLGFKYRF